MMTGELLYPQSWLPDGGGLLCMDRTGHELAILPSDGKGQTQTVLKTSYQIFRALISPDGKSVAYVSAEVGGAAIYVATFPSFGEKRRVSLESGGFPVWTKGGRELVYRTIEGMLVAAEIRGGTGPEVGGRQNAVPGRGAEPVRRQCRRTADLDE
jgi:hypothetical protein